MSDEIYLEPCPFCGGKPRSDLNKKTHCQLHGDASQSVRIYCYHECPARPSVSAGDVYNGGINKATVEAANAWNTRADTAAAQVAAAYERAADSIESRQKGYWESDWVRGNNSAVTACAAQIRALATDTQTDALEQVRRDAERAGYERGARLARNMALIEAAGKCDVFDGPVSESEFVNGQSTAAQQIRAAILSLMTPDEQTEAAQELALRKAVSS